MTTPSVTPAPAPQRPRFHELTVTGVERLTDQAVAVTFAVPEELRETFRFQPGQHVTLRRDIDGVDVRRSYSICLAPRRAEEEGIVRVGIARLPGGVMSGWAHQGLHPGDTVQVMSPLGSFTAELAPQAARHHVMIAAGSGITPILSHVLGVLEGEPRSQVTLVYGNRRTDSIMFLEEIADLKNAHRERFQVLHVLSREPQDAQILNGRIDEAKLEELIDRVFPVETVDEWYLCGPFGLVTGAQAVLERRGVPERHVHHEIFHVDDPLAPAPVVVDDSAPAEAVVTVTLDGRSTRIEMPSRAETILAATLRERPDAPYSCTGGVCGTCRARVVSGEVRMERNYALEPDEVDRGLVLACQAHPVSDEVTLDYDA